jgi:hypothetical protein
MTPTAASKNTALQEIKNSESQTLTHYDELQLAYSV